jgi:hypothetical protein
LNPEEGENKPDSPAIGVEVKTHPDFRTINVGWMYMMQPGMHFEAIVYSEQYEITKSLSSFQPTAPSTISRTLECKLVMDPYTAKHMALLLTTNVNEYEKKFGPIPMTAEELQQKQVSIEAEKKKTTDGIQ